jgi:hypothetical protein
MQVALALVLWPMCDNNCLPWLVSVKCKKNRLTTAPAADDDTPDGAALETAAGYVDGVNASLPRPSDNVTGDDINGDTPPSYAHVITVTAAPDVDPFAKSASGGTKYSQGSDW